MILKGQIVTLRPIEEEDLEFVRTLFNDPELESLVVGWSWPVSKYQHRKWFEKVSAGDFPDDGCRMAGNLRIPRTLGILQQGRNTQQNVHKQFFAGSIAEDTLGSRARYCLHNVSISNQADRADFFGFQSS